jgi:hypothetical protein
MRPTRARLHLDPGLAKIEPHFSDFVTRTWYGLTYQIKNHAIISKANMQSIYLPWCSRWQAATAPTSAHSVQAMRNLSILQAFSIANLCR